MFRSLRVRLPLLFLAGIVLAGLVTTLIAVQLFRQFSRDQTLSELRREANGIAELYSNAVNGVRSSCETDIRKFRSCVSASASRSAISPKRSARWPISPGARRGTVTS